MKTAKGERAATAGHPGEQPPEGLGQNKWPGQTNLAEGQYDAVLNVASKAAQHMQVMSPSPQLIHKASYMHKIVGLSVSPHVIQTSFCLHAFWVVYVQLQLHLH